MHSAILESSSWYFFSTTRAELKRMRFHDNWRLQGSPCRRLWKPQGVADNCNLISLDNTNRGWSLRWRHPHYTCLYYPSYTWRSFAFKVAPPPLSTYKMAALPSFVQLMASLGLSDRPTLPPTTQAPPPQSTRSECIRSHSTPSLRELAGKQYPSRYSPYSPTMVSFSHRPFTSLTTIKQSFHKRKGSLCSISSTSDLETSPMVAVSLTFLWWALECNLILILSRRHSTAQRPPHEHGGSDTEAILPVTSVSKLQSQHMCGARLLDPPQFLPTLKNSKTLVQHHTWPLSQFQLCLFSSQILKIQNLTLPRQSWMVKSSRTKIITGSFDSAGEHESLLLALPALDSNIANQHFL